MSVALNIKELSTHDGPELHLGGVILERMLHKAAPEERPACDGTTGT